jgi:hypothetical protein
VSLPTSKFEQLGWIVKIESQNRIRFPGGIESRIPWLVGDVSKEALICTGPNGQLLVFLDDSHADAINAAVTALGTRAPGISDADSSALDAVRLLAARWPVTFNFEPAGRRYTLTIPRAIRNFGFFPNPGQHVLVIALRGFLEIWAREAWVSRPSRAEILTGSEVIERLREDWGST